MIEKFERLIDIENVNFGNYPELEGNEEIIFLNEEEIEISNNLSDVLKDRGLNTSDLAKLTGISRQNINAVLHGKMKPGIDFALKVAHVLNMPVGAIFELKEHAWTTPYKPQGDSTLFLNMLTKEVVDAKTKREQVRETGYEYFDVETMQGVTKKDYNDGLREHLNKHRQMQQDILRERDASLTLNQAKSIATDQLTEEYNMRYKPLYRKLGIKIEPIVIPHNTK